MSEVEREHVCNETCRLHVHTLECFKPDSESESESDSNATFPVYGEDLEAQTQKQDMYSQDFNTQNQDLDIGGRSAAAEDYLFDREYSASSFRGKKNAGGSELFDHSASLLRGKRDAAMDIFDQSDPTVSLRRNVRQRADEVYNSMQQDRGVALAGKMGDFERDDVLGAFVCVLVCMCAHVCVCVYVCMC